MRTKSPWVSVSTAPLLLVVLLLLVASAVPGHANHEEDGRYGGGCRGFNGDDKVTDVLVVTGLSTPTGTFPASVTWNFNTGVCGLNWLIGLTPLDGQENSNGAEPVFVRTDNADRRSFDLPVDLGLKAGVQYAVKVQLEYAKNQYGPEATVEAVPISSCVANGTPGAPGSFYLKQQNWEGYLLSGDAVEVCWTPSIDPERGCSDEYTLAIRKRPENQGHLFDDKHEWRFQKFTYAGCHRVDGFDRDTTYDVGIRAYNAANQTSGDVAVLSQHVTDRWQCLPGDDPVSRDRGDGTHYEWCSAAKQGRCTPMSCEEISAADMCGHPSVRRYDPALKTVVQYCAGRCGCGTPDKDEIGMIPYLRPDDNERACCRRES